MLKTWGSLLVLLWSLTAIAAPCPEALPNEEFISKGDISIVHTVSEAAGKFDAVYVSPRRLRNRVFGEPGAYFFRRAGELIHVPDTFVAHVARQISLALKRGYADFIFYPDMGHAHLQVPADADLPLTTNADYESLLARSDLQMLYHTAELFLLKDKQGKLTEDPHLQWRYYSRNIVGDNVTGDNLAVLFSNSPTYNTVQLIDGHVERGIFDISANQNGCFDFVQDGVVRHFDLAFEWSSSLFWNGIFPPSLFELAHVF